MSKSLQARSKNAGAAKKNGNKRTYSGWYCKPAPPNILSMLRFDHLPENLKLPTQSTIEEGYKRSSAAVNHDTGGRQSSGVSKLKTRRKIDVLNDRDSKEDVELRQSASEAKRIANQHEKVSPHLAIVDAIQKERLVVKRDDITRQSRAQGLSNRSAHQGIRSSRFCKVLRILGEIPFEPRVRPQKKLPTPQKRPPIWAETRQELCEALPYYRSFQSGIYMHKKIAFGYLLEAFPAPRDIWAYQGRVIISHGGGQCIKNPNSESQTNIPATLQADQSRNDSRVDTLLLAHEKKIPIILIAGKGYDELPWNLDCAYVVLGWYWISFTWVEAEPCASGIKPPDCRDYFHRYKIRFDWVESQGIPWWINDPITPIPMEPTPRDEERSPLSPLSTYSYAVKEHQIAKDNQDRVPHLSHSPRSTVKDLLNPTVTAPPSPPDSSSSFKHEPCKNTADIQKWDNSMTSSNDSAHQRGNIWPGEIELSTQDPMLSFSDNSLQRPNFHSSFSCSACHRRMFLIYKEGLICLRPDCKAFFMIVTRVGILPIPPGFHLTYEDDFLKPVSTPPQVILPYGVIPLEPAQRVPEADIAEGEVGGRTLWKGWVCRQCGRANCRYRWEVWECKNCGNLLAPIDYHSLVPKKVLPCIDTFLGNSKIHPSSGITSTIKWIAEIGCVCMVYDLPSAGKVYHLLQPHSPTCDGLLEDYQKAAIEGGWFQRRPLKATTVKGQFLAQHFAVNFGAAYKYQVDTLSFPFEKAPKCVLISLAMITHHVKLIFGEEIKFNEILNVMYREGQKMSWHDDGEKGLGPIVSSLSLGNQAIMSFRPKIQRIQLNKSFYTGSINENKNTPPISLSFTLSHGDIMIMQGRDIQKKYDHKVVPTGFRIASTARVIGV
ncbi:uncharacterized protein I206_102711 [Kwoniella pini CBS 10737]|uniref:Fe2OG dioxygenase domain-containing protein n=1 Tax=Kwoniella pini CBS 10737 TaxID=1296096 RepID=A0AAJ8MMC1_9TREE